MSSKKKSAVWKRDHSREPEVQILKESAGKSYPPGAMLIASPLEVGRVVAQIPQGNVMTLKTLREVLAARFRADYTCSLTTGIFLRILAEAAEEEGSTASCPYWRVVRADGRLNEKLPGGERVQADRLAEEGIACRPCGKSGWKVENLSRHVWITGPVS